MSSTTVLNVSDLTVSYRGQGLLAKPRRVLENVSVSLARGETLGLVGESGSGKSTLGRAVLGLAPIERGSVALEGRDITKLRLSQRRAIASDLQVVFQDPYGSLNPAMTVREIIVEPLVQGGASAADAERRLVELLDQVQLPTDSASRYASEFSGGQRQRVAIARALIRRPKVIICDEVVSALDLSTQARIVDLLIEIQKETGVAYLFTSHDLSVVRAISHRVAVLYRGRIVETGNTRQVIEDPRDAYTQRLLMAAPVPDPERQRGRREHYLARFGSASQSTPAGQPPRTHGTRAPSEKDLP